MKQHITDKQWNELEENAQTEWEELYPDSYSIGCPICGKTGLPDIGQMIEFLDEHENEIGLYYGSSSIGWEFEKEDFNHPMFVTSELPEELCDALWEACKYILEKE